MLSTPAANALLKTLEEPPSHVVFVLATTDPQKVPPTIRSRTQHLEFRLLGADTLRDLLESVKDEAGLKVDDESVLAAVRRGRGSARDALSALDQVAASGTSESARPDLAAALNALSEGDVSDVLVTTSALLASGWGPQQLATELVDDLRQVFLSALAPELCDVSDASLDRFKALAETMRLSRVVRAMEVVGQALVDMRDAPDAQVVLEMAVVRATRPDLDSGIEALSERVSSLERALSSGNPSERAAMPAGPAAPVRPTAPPPTPDDVGQRPSLGAVRRRQESVPAESIGEADGALSLEPVPPQASPPMTMQAEPEPEDVPSSSAVDRDSLTEAWGDVVLRALPARAKALYSAGRFVAVDAQGANFALPNAAHRDRCVDLIPQVEAALAEHFRTPVKLVLVVDDARPGAPVRAEGSERPPSAPSRAPSEEEVDDVDPADLRQGTDAQTDQATEAEARLLDAFPGASEVAK